MKMFEEGIGYKSGLADFKKHLNAYTISTGILPVFIICLTVGAVLVSLLEGVGLTIPEIASWKFIIYVCGGLLSLILAPYYKQPIVGAYSIPGMVLVASSMEIIPYKEAISGFFLAGVIVLLLGVTGSMKKIIKYIPLPIMSAMISGVLFAFSLRIIASFEVNITVAIAGLVGYYIFHRWIPRTPGILGTIIFGVVAAIISKEFATGPITLTPALPVLQMPVFSLRSFISIGIPLAIIVIGAENMQAIGVLKTIKMDPPINTLTIVSGIAGIVTSIFGGHNANIAGPTTALCAGPEAGKLEGRYVAAVLAGVTFIVYGIFARSMVDLIVFFPASLNHILIGLVMLPMVARSFVATWQDGKLLFGPMFALMVAISNLTLFQISAPFWSLVFGCLASIFLESKQYRAYIKEQNI